MFYRTNSQVERLESMMWSCRLFLSLVLLFSPVSYAASQSEFEKHKSSDGRRSAVRVVTIASDAESSEFLSDTERLEIVSQAYYGREKDNLVRAAGLEGILMLSKEGVYSLDKSGQNYSHFMSELNFRLRQDDNTLAKQAFAIYRNFSEYSIDEDINLIREAKNVPLKKFLIMRGVYRNDISDRFVDVLTEELVGEFPSAKKDAATALLNMQPPPPKALPYIVDMVTKDLNYFADIRLMGLLSNYGQELIPYEQRLQQVKAELRSSERRHSGEKLKGVEHVLNGMSELESRK